MYYPGRERVEECARTFGDLADRYYHMPCRKESFSRQDIEEIFEELTRTACSGCAHFEECWKKQALRTYQRMYETLEQMEDGQTQELCERMRAVCVCPERVVEHMTWIFRNMRLRLYYSNRLRENREAVADQRWEMSRLLDDMLDEVQKTGEMKEPVNRKICRLFARRGVIVKKIFLMQKRCCEEIYISMYAKKGECVPARDLAGILSAVLRRRIVPARDTRNMIGVREDTLLFVEDTKYSILYGVSRVAKSGEEISGDSFSYMQSNQGEAVLSLSDGMGSGADASRESRRLIELLERFLEAGVGKDTALKLINSTEVYERKGYSTLDVCSVDLYTGCCELRKLGAAPTFLYRNGRVEKVQALRVPAGLFHHLELEVNQVKLADGDYIIMLTDGALEAFRGEGREEQLERLIKEQTAKNPRELAGKLMDGLLEACRNHASDDMTVYVAGIWRKSESVLYA